MSAGAARWLAIQVAAIGVVGVVQVGGRRGQPSYSTTSRRLPYGLSLSSSVAGRPGSADILGWPALPRMVCMVGKSIRILRITWQLPGYREGFAWNSSRSGHAVLRGFARPRHLADLDAAGRRAAVAELGQPGVSGPTSCRGTTSAG